MMLPVTSSGRVAVQPARASIMPARKPAAIADLTISLPLQAFPVRAGTQPISRPPDALQRADAGIDWLRVLILGKRCQHGRGGFGFGPDFPKRHLAHGQILCDLDAVAICSPVGGAEGALGAAVIPLRIERCTKIVMRGGVMRIELSCMFEMADGAGQKPLSARSEEHTS